MSYDDITGGIAEALRDAMEGANGHISYVRQCSHYSTSNNSVVQFSILYM